MTEEKYNTTAAPAPSPELTGGAGFSYEDIVVTYYLVALLRDEGASGVNGRVVSVAVQRAGHDQPMDDLVVEFNDGETAKALGLQVKRRLAISSNNADFCAVLTAALAVNGKTSFNPDTDWYGFVAEFVAVEPLRSLQRLIDWAKASPTEADFTRYFEPGGSAAASERNMLFDLTTVTGENNRAAFFRQFAAQKMEGLWDGGQMRADLINRLRESSASGELSDGALLFDRLCRLVREGEANAKKWTRATLLKDLGGAVRLKVSSGYTRDIEALSTFSLSGITAIPSDIEGFHVPRSAVEQQIFERLETHRLVNITGLPGCGKSVLLKNIASAASDGGPILFLKSDQLVGTNWPTFAGQLGLSHSLAELLTEIGAKGTPTLFIDGIDRIRTDQKAIITDILHAIEKQEDAARWRVLASSRDQGLEPYRAWFPTSFYGKKGIGDVTVKGFSDVEVEALAAQKPLLKRLLNGDEQVRHIARRPFFAAVMARSVPEDAPAPRTEVDLIAAWWARGGHDAALSDIVLRQRAMLVLAECGVQSLGKNIATRSIPATTLPQLAALESDRIIRGINENLSYSFAHDIFFEWAFFRLLLDLGQDWISAIVRAGEPPLLGRVVGLLAQHSVATSGQWTSGLRLIEKASLRPQWRREWLTAPPFTAEFEEASPEFEQVVFADDYALLEKLLVWFQAQHTIPSPIILAQPSLVNESMDKLHVADLLGWPSDFTSWERFIRWLLAHTEKLPVRLLPSVLEILGVWQNACADLRNSVSRLIVDVAAHWLIDVEAIRYAEDRRRFAVGKWEPLGEKSLDRFETSLRQMLLRAARAFPNPAITLLDRAVANKSMREKAYGDLIGYSLIISEVAPDRLVAVAKAKILEELPRDRLDRQKRERREQIERLEKLRAIPEDERTAEQQKVLDFAPVSQFIGSAPDRDEIGIERFGNDYYPTSALEQPFDALFNQAPEFALQLVKELANHGTKGWVQSQEIGGGTPIPIDLDFPWGKQRFWGGWQVYSWAQGQLAPNSLECAFLALAHWAHKQLDAGKPADDVIRAVLEGCESYAVVGLALTLVHETYTISETTLPLMTCQRLWDHDINRMLQAPTRGIEIPAFGLIDRLLGAKAEAQKYLTSRPSNQREVRQLAMLFALSPDNNLRERFRTAVAQFPDDLPFEFEEERGNVELATQLREKAERWAGLGDSTNYRQSQDDQKVYVHYDPPGGMSAKQQQQLDSATAYLYEQNVLGWTTRYLETGNPREGMTLAEAVTLAREKDRPTLFRQREDVGDHTRQSVVSSVAACVLRHGFDDRTNLDWALDVLRRIEKMEELPNHFAGVLVPWHPSKHLVVGLAELRKRNSSDKKLVERLLLLTTYPLDDVAKLALTVLLRDPDEGIAWVAMQLAFDLSLSYRPIIRRDGHRDNTTERKANAEAVERARHRVKKGVTEYLDPFPAPWAKSSTRLRGRDWEDEDKWIDPNPYFYSKDVAKIVNDFPIETWLASPHMRPLFEKALEQWVRWTAEKLMPSGKEHNVSDRASADIFEWARALGGILSRVSPLLDDAFMRHVLAPFLVDGDAALAVLARFTDHMVCRHVFDAAIVPVGTVGLLDACLDRFLRDRTFERGWRAGELHGLDLPDLADALLFVNVEHAPNAARFVNGNWSEIELIMPLVTKLVERIGWATPIASRFLTLCERAGTAYNVEVFARQANAILDALASSGEHWTGTFLPARMASVVQRLAEANYPLKADVAQHLLSVLDGLVDLGDRRSAALEQSDAFKRVQGGT